MKKTYRLHKTSAFFNLRPGLEWTHSWTRVIRKTHHQFTDAGFTSLTFTDSFKCCLQRYSSHDIYGVRTDFHAGLLFPASSYVTQLVDRTWPGCHLHFLPNILQAALEETGGKTASSSCRSPNSSAGRKTWHQPRGTGGAHRRSPQAEPQRCFFSAASSAPESTSNHRLALQL